MVGEVVVADNGSTDGSIEIAEALGARVVPVTGRGYGNALIGGIEAARGRYVIMGDADDSYDFLEVPRFVAELRQGYDLVQGCRLPKGGGTVLPGAMPWLAPLDRQPDAVVAGAARCSRRPMQDIYCGMRGFTRDVVRQARAAVHGHGVRHRDDHQGEPVRRSASRQLPITLSPDGRRSRRPHLRTFRDGWRTLRFFLIFSPRWMFWYSGLTLMLLGRRGLFHRVAGARRWRARPSTPTRWSSPAWLLQLGRSRRCSRS